VTDASQPGEANRVEISGKLIALGALRHTPAGIPVVEFRLRHESERAEAGTMRKVNAEIDAISFESLARLVAGATLNGTLRVEGFLAAKSRNSKKPILHATRIEFIEGV
jgi:primosomal replication protein N